MARKKENMDKVMEVTASMKGELSFSDPINLRINGRFEGNLKTRGNLIIGEKAVVCADIEGENIVISGMVRGRIVSDMLVTVTSTASVYGDIETPKLVVEEGGIFNVHCKMSGEKMSLPEIADYLSVDVSRVSDWVNSGKIPVQKQGGDLIFDRREVELWMEESR